MATTVSYKGATLTTVNNQTRTLDTAGTWVEGDFTLTDSSLDVSDTTATASDVAQGKVFYDSAGQRTTGTASGGGGNIGGLANMVDISDSTYEIGYMLSAMKNGNTVGGTVTYTENFPNTETLLLSTGLAEIHGFMFANPEIDIGTGTGSDQTNKWIMGFAKAADTFNYVSSYTNTVARTYGAANGAAINTAPINGTLRISGGDIYYTGRYNRNGNYQILKSNTLYEWLAW